MTVYRVGDAGATVFSTDGEPIATLRPGQVIVPGSVEVAGSLAAQHADNELVRTKQLRRGWPSGYADKRLAPAEDRSV